MFNIVYHSFLASLNGVYTPLECVCLHLWEKLKIDVMDECGFCSPPNDGLLGGLVK